MSSRYTIVPYEFAQLKKLLAQKSGASQHAVESKYHTEYFREYFHEIGANTILVEEGYVDRDFLEDYAGYYVRCFHQYPRRCVRLHFFDKSFDFDEEHFDSLLSQSDPPGRFRPLQESYLGFVVLKPLPRTIIGRTCLRTYGSDEGRRDFPILREYKANLFGIPLSVETLAFQEQDKAAAACATSAM